jgi:hypothetical protein
VVEARRDDAGERELAATGLDFVVRLGIEAARAGVLLQIFDIITA